MTRILVLSNMYPPHHLGGYELSCDDVMTRLAGRGHEVTVLTTTMRVPSAAEDVAEGPVPVRRDLTFYWADHRLVTPPLRARLRIERANQEALRAALEESQPDVVSVWNMGAMSLGLLATISRCGIPMVLAICDDWPVYGPALDPWSRLFVGRRRLGALVERLTGVPALVPDLGSVGPACFVSEFIRTRIEERSRWTFSDAAIVYSGVDRGDFPLDAGAEERPWRDRLLFVGRLDPRKGLPTVLRALALLPSEVSLEVVGPGSAEEQAEVRREALDAGVADRVVVTPGVPRAELAGRYRAADAVVFASEWQEPFGLVPLEAMSCGTPVIATGTGGSAEFLRDGTNCLLYRPGDASALAAAVTRLRGDDALRRRLVAKGLETAAPLDTNALADVFEAWHVAAAERCASGRPRDRPRPVPADAA